MKIIKGIVFLVAVCMAVFILIIGAEQLPLEILFCLPFLLAYYMFFGCLILQIMENLQKNAQDKKKIICDRKECIKTGDSEQNSERENFFIAMLLATILLYIIVNSNSIQQALSGLLLQVGSMIVSR
jgi:hypothetical protein